MYIRTWPDEETLKRSAAESPEYMHPNPNVPVAVMAEEAISKQECEVISSVLWRIPGHRLHECNAKYTQDIGHEDVLEGLRGIALMLNDIYFGFDLDEIPHSYMQTYEVGNYYQKHMDGWPGVGRKCTAVLMLTDPNEYRGGELMMEYHPNSFQVNPAQGTVALFPSWILHTVSPVTYGTRQTINMGFFGPPFR